MSNKGTYELNLLDVRGKLITDPRVTVRFRRGTNGRPIATVNARFPSQRRFKGLPAFPQGRNLYCEITPSRFHHRKSGFFTLREKRITKSELIVLRIPTKWKPRFENWNRLPSHIQPLKKVLQGSLSLKLRGRDGRVLGRLIGAHYDNIRDKQAILAKACLLNLFAKMTALGAPTTRRNWFSFVREILEIGQDRFIALADPQMGQIVRRIVGDIKNFRDYKRTAARNHYKNVRDVLPGSTVRKSQMISIKSKTVKGNLQLVLAPGQDAQGNDVLLLDVDIDESGELLPHFFDFIKHRVTGKRTNPYEIHEYLALAHPTMLLGYDLEVI